MNNSYLPGVQERKKCPHKSVEGFQGCQNSRYYQERIQRAEL